MRKSLNLAVVRTYAGIPPIRGMDNIVYSSALWYCTSSRSFSRDILKHKWSADEEENKDTLQQAGFALEEWSISWKCVFKNNDRAHWFQADL